MITNATITLQYDDEKDELSFALTGSGEAYDIGLEIMATELEGYEDADAQCTGIEAPTLN